MTYNHWLMARHDRGRSGNNPAFPVDESAEWYKYCDIPVDSAVRGAPLLLENWTIERGPHAGETHNMVYVATSGNRVYAYAEEQLLTGSATPIWAIGPTDLGCPSMRAGSNIPPPIGITSTPVIDPESQQLYVVMLHDDPDPAVVTRFDVAALDVDTGAVLQKVPLRDAGHPGRPTFAARAHDQRGGLNLANGWVYATFADFYNNDAEDEGYPYHGWIVACHSTDLTQQLFLPVTNRLDGGGIWGPGGVAVDDAGRLFACTGNSMDAVGLFWIVADGPGGAGSVREYFMSVVRVEQTGTGLTVTDWYGPHDMESLNASDEDLGGSSPCLLPQWTDPTGRTWELLVTCGKDGNVYLLDRDTLGHLGGSVWRKGIFQGGSDDGSKIGPAYLQTGSATYVYVVGEGKPGLVAFTVEFDPEKKKPELSAAWQADALSLGKIVGSPVIVTSPGGASLVWIHDDGDDEHPKLRAYDAVSGIEVFNSDSKPGDNLSQTPHFPAISAAGRSVFVGTQSSVACYTQRPTLR